MLIIATPTMTSMMPDPREALMLRRAALFLLLGGNNALCVNSYYFCLCPDTLRMQGNAPRVVVLARKPLEHNISAAAGKRYAGYLHQRGKRCCSMTRGIGGKG